MKNLLTLIILMVSYSVIGQVGSPPPSLRPEAPPAPPIYEREVFKVVEEMPTFPGCEKIEGKAEKSKCTFENLTKYISENLVYPKEAKNKKVTGTAVVQFVVDKDGTLSDIKTIRDLGAETGQAAAEVVHKMNSDRIIWNAGKQRGRLVDVQYTLPIKFEL